MRDVKCLGKQTLHYCSLSVLLSMYILTESITPENMYKAFIPYIIVSGHAEAPDHRSETINTNLKLRGGSCVKRSSAGILQDG